MIDEQILVQRIQAGDHEAFRDIFERYRNQVYRFCLFTLEDEDAAKDIYQETFVAFYQACRDGTTPRNVRNYILTAARNRSLNYLKARRNHQPLHEVHHEAALMNDEASDANGHVWSALMQIPPQYKEAFLLAELWDYRYDEIAELLDISQHTVKNRIYRARVALRKLLTPSGEANL